MAWVYKKLDKYWRAFTLFYYEDGALIMPSGSKLSSLSLNNQIIFIDTLACRLNGLPYCDCNYFLIKYFETGNEYTSMMMMDSDSLYKNISKSENRIFWSLDSQSLELTERWHRFDFTVRVASRLLRLDSKRLLPISPIRLTGIGLQEQFF